MLLNLSYLEFKVLDRLKHNLGLNLLPTNHSPSGLLSSDCLEKEVPVQFNLRERARCAQM